MFMFTWPQYWLIRHKRVPSFFPCENMTLRNKTLGQAWGVYGHLHCVECSFTPQTYPVLSITLCPKRCKHFVLGYSIVLYPWIIHIYLWSVLSVNSCIYFISIWYYMCHSISAPNLHIFSQFVSVYACQEFCCEKQGNNIFRLISTWL